MRIHIFGKFKDECKKEKTNFCKLKLVAMSSKVVLCEADLTNITMAENCSKLALTGIILLHRIVAWLSGFQMYCDVA
jgi:hypothetical protein